MIEAQNMLKCIPGRPVNHIRVNVGAYLCFFICVHLSGYPGELVHCAASPYTACCFP